MPVPLRNPEYFGDAEFADLLLKLGTDNDCVFVVSSAGLSANEELKDVIVGTSVYPQAIPANSLIISDVTDDGDIVFFGATGGNSIEAMRIDASARNILVPDGNGLVIGHDTRIDIGSPGTLQVLGTAGADSAVINEG